MTNAAQQTESLLGAFRSPDADDGEELYDYREDYWLAKPYFSTDLAAEVVQRFQKHVEKWQGGSPIAMAAWTAYRMYHGLTRAERGDSPVVSLTETGKDGEFLSLSVNALRSLIRLQISLTTGNRAAWQPQARTSGAEASRQVTLASNLLDHCMDAKGMAQMLRNQLECERVVSVGFAVVGWDANAGRGGQGDIWAQELAPWELCHERVRKYTDSKWCVFRRLEPRWDWIAKIWKAARAATGEARAELVRKLESLRALEYDKTWFTDVDDRPQSTAEDNDRIPVLYLYAAPTLACPDGRRTLVAGADLVLEDGPLPYDAPPVVRMCSAEFIGTCEGIADSWPQLPLQEALTGVLGAIITRIDMGAVPDIATPEGSEFEQGTLGGANQISVPEGGGVPTLVDLLKIAPELPAVAEMLERYMEKGSNINSVTRGNPNENITSGSMAALVAAQAVQANSATELAYAQAQEELGTIIVNIYRRHATEEQLVSIAGQDQLYTARAFKAEDLNQILRVSVKIASPLMKTLAGRSDLATRMLEQKVIEDPREYLEVVETGNLTPIFKGPVDQLRIIKEENEAMRRGEQVHVEMTDDPYLHIREHGCELDTQARYDQAYANRLREHNEEHYKLLANMSRTDPDRCVAYGYQPLPGALAMAQQVAQMQGAGSGPPSQPSAPPRKLPNAEEPKEAKPGPAPKPPGQEPMQAAPTMPMPAEAPKGSV
jgi:hypothetical protein